jgi:hypothetical protein
MRLLCVSIRAPNTPDPNFLHVYLSIFGPFCISHHPQLGSAVTGARESSLQAGNIFFTGLRSGGIQRFYITCTYRYF